VQWLSASRYWFLTSADIISVMPVPAVVPDRHFLFWPYVVHRVQK